MSQRKLNRETNFRLLKNASVPDIDNFCGLHGPILLQNTLEKVGGEALPPFQMSFAGGGAVQIPTIDDFWPGSTIKHPEEFKGRFVSILGSTTQTQI